MTTIKQTARYNKEEIKFGYIFVPIIAFPALGLFVGIFLGVAYGMDAFLTSFVGCSLVGIVFSFGIFLLYQQIQREREGIKPVDESDLDYIEPVSPMQSPNVWMVGENGNQKLIGRGGHKTTIDFYLWQSFADFLKTNPESISRRKWNSFAKSNGAKLKDIETNYGKLLGDLVAFNLIGEGEDANALRQGAIDWIIREVDRRTVVPTRYRPTDTPPALKSQSTVVLEQNTGKFPTTTNHHHQNRASGGDLGDADDMLEFKNQRFITIDSRDYIKQWQVFALGVTYLFLGAYIYHRAIGMTVQDARMAVMFACLLFSGMALREILGMIKQGGHDA